MNEDQIAKQYNINGNEFADFVKRRGLPHSPGLFDGVMIEPHLVDRYVRSFLEDKYTREQAEAVSLAREAQDTTISATKKSQAISNMLISSGFSFDGYKIVKYSGYISGDSAVQIPRSDVFGGNNGSNLTNALARVRQQALRKLREVAYALGCNAVIGVDYDYLTLEPETASRTGGTLYEPYIICVTANGNAVVIEPNE